MNLQRRIQISCDSFAADITALVRAELLSFLGKPPQATPKRTSERTGLAPYAKRTPGALIYTTAALATYLRSHPAQRIEQIAKGMRCSTAMLALPMQRLSSCGRIATTGEKRATRYTLTNYNPAGRQ